MDQGFAQATCQILSLKLKSLASMPEEMCGGELERVAREIREALIVLGRRKRKTRPVADETDEPKKRGKRIA